MTRMTVDPQTRLNRLGPAIRVLALHLTKDESTTADLEQEMACHLLALPPGHTRAWYLSRVGDHARKYLGRCIVDAPLGPSGWPILARRTVAVGGLHELDHLCRQHAA